MLCHMVRICNLFEVEESTWVVIDEVLVLWQLLGWRVGFKGYLAVDYGVADSRHVNAEAAGRVFEDVCERGSGACAGYAYCI